MGIFLAPNHRQSLVCKVIKCINWSYKWSKVLTKGPEAVLEDTMESILWGM